MDADELAAQVAQLTQEKDFIQNWLSDLLDGMQTVLDRPAQVELFAACGRGCFRRFPFKQELAAQGKGSLDRLIAAYEHNFEIWRAEEGVHIRYGETSAGCYCPAARFRPPQPDDLHCECTRATHQAIFETALGHPVQVDILQTLRRGGQTCQFFVKVGGGAGGT